MWHEVLALSACSYLVIRTSKIVSARKFASVVLVHRKGSIKVILKIISINVDTFEFMYIMFKIVRYV